MVMENGTLCNSSSAWLCSGNVSSDSGHVTSDSGNVTSDSGNVTSDSGNVTSHSGNVTSDTGNVSVALPWYYHELKVATEVLMSLLVSAMIIGIGSLIDVKDLSRHRLQYLLPIAVGLGYQFIILPLACYGVALACDLIPPVSIALIIVAASPTGSLCGLFSLISRGDVTLGFSLTVCSTVVALGAMPLLLFLLTSAWTDTTIQVPFLRLFLALLLVVVPLSIGMALRKRNVPHLDKLPKLGTVAGLTCVIFTITSTLLLYPTILAAAPISTWVIACLLPLCGIVFYTSLAHLLRLPPKTCRTVPFSTCPNVPLSAAIIFLTFSDSSIQHMMAFTIAFGLSSVIEMSVTAFIFRRTAAGESGGDDVEQVDKGAVEYHVVNEEQDEVKEKIGGPNTTDV